jgi:hypothetical protein
MAGGIDTSIYGMIQQPKIRDPLDSYAQAMTVGNLMNQGKLQDMQLRAAEKGVAEDEAAAAAYRESGGDLQKVRDLLYGRGLHKQGAAVDTQLLTRREKLAGIEKHETDNKTAIAKYVRDSLANVRDQMSYDAWRADAASKGAQVAKTAPDVFDPNWQKANVLNADKFIEQNTPKMELKTLPDGSQRMIDMNPNTNNGVRSMMFQPGMTPAEQDAKARGWASINKPTWDSERGVYVQPPQMGPGAASPAAAPAAQPVPSPAPTAPVARPAGPSVVTPQNLPPRASDSKLNESQGNATAFGMRAAEAHKILNALERSGTNNTGIIKSTVSGALGLTPFIGDKLDEAAGSVMNAAPRILGGPNEDQQKTEQARRDFINAVLRKESGAVISPQEFQNANRQYFPQPGDTDAVIEQKRKNRETTIKALAVQAGPGATNIPRIGGVLSRNADGSFNYGRP